MGPIEADCKRSSVSLGYGLSNREEQLAKQPLTVGLALIAIGILLLHSSAKLPTGTALSISLALSVSISLSLTVHCSLSLHWQASSEMFSFSHTLGQTQKYTHTQPFGPKNVQILHNYLIVQKRTTKKKQFLPLLFQNRYCTVSAGARGGTKE